MKHQIIYILVFVVSVLFQRSANAQINVSSISLRMGTIETETGPGEKERILNPELQIGGVFFTKYFSWGIYWSYWNDGVNKEIPWADYVTYNFSSHIFGCRLYFSPWRAAEKRSLPIDAFVGIAEHFVKGKYIGGESLTGKGSTYWETTTTMEAGLALQIKIDDNVNIFCEAQHYFLVRGYVYKMQRAIRAYKIGVSYSL